MRFINAENGIKKIFTAEVLALLGGIALTVTAVLGLFTVGSLNADSEAGAFIYGSGTVIFGITGVIFLCIAYILNLAGIVKAGNDEDTFKTAFWFVIIALIISFASVFFSGNETISHLCDHLIKLSSLFTTIFIIAGIRKIALKLKRSDIDRKGDNLFKIIIFIYVLIFIAKITANLFKNDLGAFVAVTLVIAAGILEIAQFILYLSYLSQAKKMLAENNK